MFAQNTTQERMFREAIKAELKRQNLTVKHVTRELGLNYSNFNEFLKGTRETYPLDKLEKVIEYLHLEIKPQ
jgi:transcriptional regulator with XRE-family HTH domain